jgi:hypothetical protein
MAGNGVTKLFKILYLVEVILLRRACVRSLPKKKPLPIFQSKPYQEKLYITILHCKFTQRMGLFTSHGLVVCRSHHLSTSPPAVLVLMDGARDASNPKDPIVLQPTHYNITYL